MLTNDAYLYLLTSLEAVILAAKFLIEDFIVFCFGNHNPFSVLTIHLILTG